MNKFEIVRNNIINGNFIEEIIDRIIYKSDDEINELYTSEKEKHKDVFKIVKMKSGVYAYSFGDDMLCPAAPSHSLRMLKEMYICVSKEAPEEDSIDEEIQ